MTLVIFLIVYIVSATVSIGIILYRDKEITLSGLTICLIPVINVLAAAIAVMLLIFEVISTDKVIFRLKK